MIGALVAVALLAVNAFFVGAEFAFVTARRAKMEELAEGGNRRAKIAVAATRELSFMLAGAQLGITMASIGLGYVAEPAVASLIEQALTPFVSLPSALLHTISFIVALSLVLYFHLVVGEHIPKNIAIAKPDASLLWIAVPFNFYATLFRPFIRLLNGLANGALRLIRIHPKDELFSAASPGDVASILRVLNKEGVIKDFQHRMLSGTLTLHSLDAESIMVPRTEVIAVPIQATVAEIERVVVETERTRLPVFEGDIDNLIGFVHAKDLLRTSGSSNDRPVPRRLIRELLLVPPSKKLSGLLGDMRSARVHLAAVIDEHGGTAGIVTLEDVLKEIVGEILDESGGQADKVRRVGPNRFLVPGKLRPDELESATGVVLPEGDYETLGGFIMQELGRLPREGDEVRCQTATLKVQRMNDRQVQHIEVVYGPILRKI